ncbi:MAG: hypothetical protein EOP45_11860 [Sphingobacteriaceae bacterium]|nr:MAG: hypothetical protein EOP45_11860 [Sphingobacteriaceae bacterium]
MDDTVMLYEKIMWMLAHSPQSQSMQRFVVGIIRLMRARFSHEEDKLIQYTLRMIVFITKIQKDGLLAELLECYGRTLTGN